MALIVEDGTGLATSDTYISVADAIVYLDKYAASGSANPFTAAPGGLATQEPALRNGTRYLDGEFNALFSGRRDNAEQALQWGRVSAVYNDGLPVDPTFLPLVLVQATAIMGLRWVELQLLPSSAELGILDPDIKNPGRITLKRLKADVLETETEWEDGGAGQTRSYTAAFNMLTPILVSPGKVTLA